MAPAEVVAAARAAAGIIGGVRAVETNEGMAELLGLHRTSSGGPDGMGYAVAGGLAALENLSVDVAKPSQRRTRAAVAWGMTRMNEWRIYWAWNSAVEDLMGSGM